MSTEAATQARILDATVGRPDVILWRGNVVGAAVALPEVRAAMRAAGIADSTIRAVCAKLRPRDAGLPGQADLIGMRARDGRFLGVEVKSPTGRQSDRQKRFESMVHRMGGVYVVARSWADVEEVL